MDKATVEWNGLSAADGQARYDAIRRANLLQSPAYARAACSFYGQTARQGLIRINGTAAGLVQIQEAGLFKNAVHALILDRGPLWFDGFGTESHNEAFFRTFAKEFPARFGRRRRIIPEVEHSDQALSMMAAMGYGRTSYPGYQTAWVDLTRPIDELRSGLKQKWRNLLNKAEKQRLVVEWDENGKFLPLLLTNYQSDRAKKGYDGPSVTFLRALSGSFLNHGGVIIGQAKLENHVIAAILLLCHGSSATYQVGWTTREGRDRAAHNFLLWQGVVYLKDKGIKDFDLGGMNDESAQGVKKFKDGMGGQQVTLVGQYR